MAAALGGTASVAGDRKKLGIVAGLVGVLLVVIVVRVVLPNGGGVSDSARAADGLSPGRKSLLDSQPGYMETIARIARLQSEKSYDVGDSRDPMEPLVRERTTKPSRPRMTEEVRVSTELPRMSLHGIIWDLENPVAIIDGLDLRVGDTIKGARIVEIQYDRVVLTYRSRQHVLVVD